MGVFILKGDIKAKEHFISELVIDGNIAPYNINVFTEPLKISEARGIKNSLSVSTNGQRLFVIKGSPMPEAQNALLKTLEEFPDDSSLVFFEDRKLLPTVVSRCRIINLGEAKQAEANEYDAIVKVFIENSKFDMASVIVLVDKLNLQELDPDLLVFSLRSVLMQFIEEKKYSNAVLINNILDKFFIKYPLLINNNLNKKLAIESAVFESIKHIV